MRALACGLVGLTLVVGCGDGGDGFVSMWTNGDRLRARVQVSEDGYRGLVGWRDVELGLDCLGGENGRPLCAPPARYVYSDDACLVPVSVEAGASPFVVIDERAFRVAVPSMMGTLYFGGSTGCRRISEGEYWPLDEVPADTLVRRRVEPVDDQGLVMQRVSDDGSVETIVHASEQVYLDGRSRLLPFYDIHERWRDQHGIFDRALGLPCTMETGVAGTTCNPPVAQPAPYFRNATCTDAVTLSAYSGLAGTDVYDAEFEPDVFAVDSSDESCDPVPLVMFMRSRSVPAIGLVVVTTLTE